MKTDKELLELAAKAAGISPHIITKNTTRIDCGTWNPLTSDGDALRLAVKLGIHILPYILEHIQVSQQKYVFPQTQTRVGDALCVLNEIHDTDPCAATRRAIVRAAAELGAK